MAINELRKEFQRICYIDLDLHHGDGKNQTLKWRDFLSSRKGKRRNKKRPERKISKKS